MRVHDADAVGADQAHAVAPRQGHHIFLVRGALRACLAEAAGDEDDGLDAALTAGFDGRKHRGGGDDQHRQIKRVGRGGQAGVTGQAEDFVGLGSGVRPWPGCGARRS